MVDIVIAGKNNIAVNITRELLRRNDIDNIYVIYNETDYGNNGFQRSFKKFCEESGISYISLSQAEKLNNIIFLSLEFDKIIKPSRFNTNKMYNIHFSLLPQYKGMYTSAWPILNGESVSGVTLHEIDQGIDTGDIIDQVKFTINDNDTAKDLYLKYIKHGTELVRDNLERIISGNLESNQQDPHKSTYYSNSSINYSSLYIELNNTASVIERKIRAFTFRDYQIPEVLGYKIRGAEVRKEKSCQKPGRINCDTSDYIEISTIDYNLRLFKDRFDSLLDSCKNNDYEVFFESVNRFNLNDCNSRGWSPVIVAAYHGNIGIVNMLIKLGANVNDTNYNGTSVLMYAKDYAWRTREIAMFEYLISQGADIGHVDYSDKSLIDYLSIEQKEFFSKFLL